MPRSPRGGLVAGLTCSAVTFALLAPARATTTPQTPGLGVAVADATMVPVQGVLFPPDGTHSWDVRQGHDGDCWFLSSLAAVVHCNATIVQNLIQDNGNGTYTVTLFNASNQPTAITVASTFAEYDFGNGLQPIGATWVLPWETQPVLWPAVIEKAYAQFDGGYLNMDWGYPAPAFQALTGVLTSNQPVITLTSASQDDVWAQLTQATANNWPMVTNTYDLPSEESARLVQGHVYAVVGTKVAADGTRSVSLRNPWGTAVKPYLGDSKGGFSYPLTDYMLHFSCLSICPL